MRIAIKGIPAFQPQAEPEEPSQPALIDNMLAPEIFATGIAGFSNINNVIVTVLETTRCDHSKASAPFERVVVGRVALTIPAAQAMVAGLNDFLEAQGLSPTRAMMGGSTRQ